MANAPYRNAHEKNVQEIINKAFTSAKDLITIGETAKRLGTEFTQIIERIAPKNDLVPGAQADDDVQE